MCVLRLSFLCCLVLCSGCGSGEGISDAFGPSQDAGAGTSTANVESFLSAYRSAHDSGDVEALMRLYCWDDVPADLRDTVRGNLQDQLLQPISHLELVPVDPSQFGETESSGRRWRPNLPVTDMLIVEFTGQGSFGLTKIEAGVGRQGGEYRIVVTVPF